MPIVQSLVQTPYKPIVKTLRTLSGEVNNQMWYTNWRGTNSQYIQLPDITLPVGTDWEVTVVAAVPDRGAYLLADRLNANGESRFGLLNDGRTFGLSDVTQAVGGDTAGMKGGNKLRVMKATAESGTINVTINNTLVNSYVVGGTTPVLNSVGRQYNGTTGVLPMLGVISLVKIEKAGTLVLDMPINQNYTPTNNTVLDLSGQGNHGTFIGIEEGDSLLYTKQGDDWVNGSTTLGGL